jgi:uncharacterized membrane protein YhaH (DUF805 family)|tara:strand:+ start:109 stop:489 length:381 start_codon:yes stop_codon:yes gene_type:complete
MDLQTSIKTCFNKYADFSGRALRSEFWFFCLFTFLGGIITVIIDVMILGYSVESYGPINLIFSVGVLLPSFAVTTRRLHDINRSGWWQLLYITIIGIVLVVIWCATEGENKKNKYGSPIKIKSKRR